LVAIGRVRREVSERARLAGKRAGIVFFAAPA
jgi:hypothetical protein